MHAMREKIVDILKENPNIPGLESFTSHPDDVDVDDDEQFSDGLVNVIGRLQAGDGSTAIAKFAPPYIKAYGEEMPLSQERVQLEMTGLQLFEQYCPGSVPKPYFYSSKHSTILMEDLSGYKMLRSELLAGNVNQSVICTLAVHMATVHRSTHKDNIGAREWTKLQERYDKHVPLIGEMITSFTTHPYIRAPPDEVAKQLKELADKRFYSNGKVSALYDQITTDYVHRQECLIHADPHTGDLLVKGDDGKIIDLECVHLGPQCVDVGMYLAHLVMAYYYHLLTPEDNDRHRKIAYKIQDCCLHMVNTYLEHMSWTTGNRADCVARLLKDITALTGWELFRSVCSGEQKQLGSSQIEMVECGIRLLEQYHVVDSVDKMMHTALSLR